VGSAPRICLGVIVGAKGLRGEVRIKSFTARPADVAAYGPVTTDDGRTFALTVTGAAQGTVTGRLKGVARVDGNVVVDGTMTFALSD